MLAAVRITPFWLLALLKRERIGADRKAPRMISSKTSPLFWIMDACSSGGASDAWICTSARYRYLPEPGSTTVTYEPMSPWQFTSNGPYRSFDVAEGSPPQRWAKSPNMNTKESELQDWDAACMVSV